MARHTWRCTCGTTKCRRHKRRGLGRSPGEGHGNPLQYSCLENHMGRGAWQAVYIVHWVAKCWTCLKRLSIRITKSYNFLLFLLKLYMNGLIQYISSKGFYLSWIYVEFIYVIFYISEVNWYSLVYIPLYEIPQFIFPFIIDGHWGCFSFSDHTSTLVHEFRCTWVHNSLAHIYN